MKRLFAFLAVMMVLFSANYAFAGDASAGDNGTAVGIDNNNSLSQISNNTNALTSSQDMANNNSVNIKNERPNVTSSNGATGEYVEAGLAAVAVVRLEDYDVSYLGEYTRKELENMIEESNPGSFMDHKGGFFESFRSRIKPALARVGNPTDRIQVYARVPNLMITLRGGSVNVNGDYDWPLEVSYYTALLVAMDYGHDKVVVNLTIRTKAKNRASNIGMGGSLAGSTAGVSVGANFGSTSAEVYTAFDASVKAVSKVVAIPEPPEEVVPQLPPAIIVPPAQKENCEKCTVEEVTAIWESIRSCELKITGDKKLGIDGCTRFCFKNLGYRRHLGDRYIDLYECTQNVEYLKIAISHYEIAERNYLQGHDIKAYQAEADAIIAQVYYNWAGCIYVLYGEKAATSFAEKHHLERIPTGFAR